MYSIGAGAWTTYSGALNMSNLGAVTVEFYSVDNAGNQESTKNVPLSIDGLAPVTTHVLAGTAGQNGWHTSAVNLTLTATDSGVGLGTVHYRIGTSTWQIYSAPVSITTEGNHTVQYYAEDVFGHTETTKSVSISIDTTSCTLSIEQADGTIFGADDYVIISWTGSDAMSGLDRYEVKVDNGSFQAYGPETESMNLTDLDAGTHSITVRAIDESGHATERSIDFVIEEEKGGGGFSVANVWPYILVAVVLAAVALLLFMRRWRATPAGTAPEEEEAPPPESDG